MSATEINEIKLGLIGWINQLSNVETIAFLDGLKKSKTKEDWWDGLSESNKKQVLAGVDDSKNGKIMPSEEFWKKLNNA